MDDKEEPTTGSGPVDSLVESAVLNRTVRQAHDADTETILSTLDGYIYALDDAEKSFWAAAGSGDQDAETDAADDLAALVRRFVDFCNNWPAPASPNNDSPQ